MDAALLEHERRLTRLEDKFAIDLSTCQARLERLEQAQAQAALDREQAARREMAEVRASADAMRRQLDELQIVKAAS